MNDPPLADAVLAPAHVAVTPIPVTVEIGGPQPFNEVPRKQIRDDDAAAFGETRARLLRLEHRSGALVGGNERRHAGAPEIDPLVGDLRALAGLWIDLEDQTGIGETDEPCVAISESPHAA